MPDQDLPLGSMIEPLPIDRLIGEPLDAMIKAQGNASLQYIDFVKSQCIKDGKAVMMEFDYDETLVDTQGNYAGVLQRTMRVPIIAMVTHPTISLTEGTVDFELEVTHFTEEKSAEEKPPTDPGTAPAAAPLSQAALGVPQRAVVKGKVSHKGEQTRRTDTRARYSVHASVKREDAPEAMMRVIEYLMDAATKPVLLPGKNPPAPETKTLPPGAGTTPQGA
jgi:hypothetical protein